MHRYTQSYDQSRNQRPGTRTGRRTQTRVCSTTRIQAYTGDAACGLCGHVPPLIPIKLTGSRVLPTGVLLPPIEIRIVLHQGAKYYDDISAERGWRSNTYTVHTAHIQFIPFSDTVFSGPSNVTTSKIAKYVSFKEEPDVVLIESTLD